MKYKPHYEYGEHGLWAATMIKSSPMRRYRGYLLTTSIRPRMEASLPEMQIMHDNMNSLRGFLDGCQNKWDFSASIADRFTRPNGVLLH